MEITEISKTFKVRALCEADAAAILALCAGNEQYYRYCPPFVSLESIGRDMRALPPGKSKEDKFYLGFFDPELAAIIDLITAYPDPLTAFIGFFMVAEERQGQGMGSRIVGELSDCLKKNGFLRMRLGYAKGNEQSEAFWQKNLFKKMGVEIPADGYTVVVMQKNL